MYPAGELDVESGRISETLNIKKDCELIVAEGKVWPIVKVNELKDCGQQDRDESGMYRSLLIYDD
jgi:hypothetical protein